MKALVFDNELKLTTTEKPTPKEGEALIKITMAAICNTDVEITKGYMGFKGILGHEFAGVVEEINGEDKSLLNKRVVGEINCGCGNCPDCANNMERHCKFRGTLGIWQKAGCFAEYITLPLKNLVEIPDHINDETAVFTEPLAAALEILEQVHIKPFYKVAVLGDGKLGLLIALVLKNTQADLTLIGKHKNKLEIVEKQGIKTKLLDDEKETKCYDIVVDATGSINGFETSMALVKPRGTIVLKSTVATEKPMNLAQIVIDEITIVGSRCGQFKPAMRLIEKELIDFKPLNEAIYSFDDAIKAFEHATTKGALKVFMKF